MKNMPFNLAFIKIAKDYGYMADVNSGPLFLLDWIRAMIAINIDWGEKKHPLESQKK